MPNITNNRQRVILVAEDNKADQVFIQRVFIKTGIHCRMFLVNDGIEAMEFLRREGNYKDTKDSPTPDLVLLDVKMPRKNGIEVLRELKGDPVLKSIPVIMLTTSNLENDIKESYNLGTNAFITKPIGFDKFVDVIESLKSFWLKDATLPTTIN